jgi:hypothetical protein
MGASRLIVSIKERLFLKFILQNITAKEAYRRINPNRELTEQACETGGWKYMNRIKEKIPWDKILGEWNLGLEKIAEKFEELLEAKVTKFYQDKSLGDFTDNSTRMRALELLVDVHKMKTQKLEVTGKDGGPVEALSTLNDIIKYHEQNKPAEPERQPDSDEVSE